MTYSTESITWHNLDCFIWECVKAIQKQCACSISTAEVLAGPLIWYINTGRASCDFLHKLIKVRPFMIARRIAEGGSTDEVVDRIKKLVEST